MVIVDAPQPMQVPVHRLASLHSQNAWSLRYDAQSNPRSHCHDIALSV